MNARGYIVYERKEFLFTLQPRYLYFGRHIGLKSRLRFVVSRVCVCLLFFLYDSRFVSLFRAGGVVVLVLQL